MVIKELHQDQNISFQCDGANLKGILNIPEASEKIVLFVHGSGSSRLSTRNQFVAKQLQDAGLSTFLFDLLTPEEDFIDDETREYRFDIDFLTVRLLGATEWIFENVGRSFACGYFGASTGAAAALKAAAHLSNDIQAVVSRGGRPDLAGDALADVQAATLLIVGGDDEVVIDLNQQAYQKLTCTKAYEIIPGATHLFEEPGKLEEVAQKANAWFKKYL